MEQQQEVIGSRSIRVGANDLEWPWKAERGGSNFSERSPYTLVRCDLEWPKLAWQLR